MSFSFLECVMDHTDHASDFLKGSSYIIATVYLLLGAESREPGGFMVYSMKLTWRKYKQITSNQKEYDGKLGSILLSIF